MSREIRHPTTAARMGPAKNPDSMVNHKLQVHGVQNLRVIDAPIMPSMPLANTYATTCMIAEKGPKMALTDKG
ncbi:GMC oxidoreductase [Pseudotabrizicola sp. 4114]|uniref:GMC oxidoreductase n=1 Tax=Pseudotabrizicola sp. 4114 TaxID=2817731 RepID=UPI0032B6FE1F